MLNLIVSNLSSYISVIAGFIAFVRFFNKNAYSRCFCILIGILSAYELFSGGIHELVPLMTDTWKIYDDFLNILFIISSLYPFISSFTIKTSPNAPLLISSTPQQHCKGYKLDGTRCQIKLHHKDYCHHHEWQDF